MNLYHLYCFIQGFAALYFIAFVAPSISLDIYKTATAFSSKHNEPTAPPSSAPPVFTSTIIQQFEHDSPYTITSKHPVSTDICRLNIIVDPAPTLEPNLPPHSRRPQPVTEEKEKPYPFAAESQSAPFNVPSKYSSSATISGSICLLVLGIFLGTAGTSRFSRPLDKTRRSVEDSDDLNVGWRPQILSLSKVKPDPVSNLEEETHSFSRGDIFGLWARPRESEIFPRFEVTSPLAAIPAKTSPESQFDSGTTRTFVDVLEELNSVEESRILPAALRPIGLSHKPQFSAPTSRITRSTKQLGNGSKSTSVASKALAETKARKEAQSWEHALNTVVASTVLSPIGSSLTRSASNEHRMMSTSQYQMNDQTRNATRISAVDRFKEIMSTVATSISGGVTQVSVTKTSREHNDNKQHSSRRMLGDYDPIMAPRSVRYPTNDLHPDKVARSVGGGTEVHSRDKVLHNNQDVLRFASDQFNKNLECLDNGIAAMSEMQRVIDGVLEADRHSRLPSRSLSPTLDPVEGQVGLSIPARSTLLAHRPYASLGIPPSDAGQRRSKQDKQLSSSYFNRHLGDYPPVSDSAKFHVESSVSNLTALNALGTRISPRVQPHAGVKRSSKRSSKRQGKASSGIHLEFLDDDLPIFNSAEVQQESSVPDLAALLAARPSVSPDILPHAEVQRLLKREKLVPPRPEADSEYSRDYSLIHDAAEIHAEPSVADLAALPAPRSRASPDIIPYADVQDLSRRDEEVSSRPHAGPAQDCLPVPSQFLPDQMVFDPAGIQRGSSPKNLARHTSRRRSFSPEEFEPIPRDEISRLMKKDNAFLDEDNSIPIAPLESSLMDVFGVKPICRDVVPEPRKKEAVSLHNNAVFIGDYPPIFSAKEIQAESSHPIIAALLATPSSISPDALPYADVHRLLRLDEASPAPLEGFVDCMPMLNQAGSMPDLAGLCARRLSFSPEHMQRKAIRPLMKRNRAFLDDDFSFPIAPVEPFSFNVPDVKLVCADVVSEPRGKNVVLQAADAGFNGDHLLVPPVFSAEKIQVESSGPTIATSLSLGRHTGVVDDLPIFNPAEVRRESSLPNLATHTSRRRSFSPEEFEPIPRDEISRLMKKDNAFFDEADSIPIAPLEPSLVDVFGVKLMCADVVSEPRKEAVPPHNSSGFISDYPPIFSAKEIQAESSDPIIAALLATPSSISPDPLPYADVHRLLRRGKVSQSRRERFADDRLPVLNQEGSQEESANPDLAAVCARKTSLSPESMPRKAVRPLAKRNGAFLDNDFSFPIAPLYPPVTDLFDAKPMCGDVVSEPRRKKVVPPAADAKSPLHNNAGFIGDYPPIFNAKEIQAESSDPVITALLATPSSISPDALPYADVHRLLRRGKVSQSRHEGFADDCLLVLNQEGSQVESANADLAVLSSRKTSLSPESMPRRTVRPLTKRNGAFLDNDFSFPIAPLDPPVTDLFGAKPMCADVVSEPRKKEAGPLHSDAGSIGDYPPIFNAEEIQAESSAPIIAALLATPSSISPDALPYADVHRLLRRGEVSQSRHEGFVDDRLPVLNLEGCQVESANADLAVLSSRKISLSPESMPRKAVRPLTKRYGAFLDNDFSFPIAPLYPPVTDLFGAKPMCADVVSEPRKKEAGPLHSDAGSIGDYPPIFNAEEIQAESSDPIIAALLATPSCISPDSLPHADVHRLLRQGKVSPSRHEGFADDCLLVLNQEGSQVESANPDLAELSSRKTSLSPESMPRKAVRPLTKRNGAFLDNDFSFPIAPLYPPVTDLFDAKLICADVVSEPGKKAVPLASDAGFTGNYPPVPPVFIAEEIQVESSNPIITTFLAPRSCVSPSASGRVSGPGTQRHTDVQQLMRGDEGLSSGRHAGPVDNLPIFNPAEIRRESSHAKLATHTSRRRSFAPEEFDPVPREEISRLMKGKEVFVDDNDRMPIAPPEPSLVDVFGVKLMCADVVSREEI